MLRPLKIIGLMAAAYISWLESVMLRLLTIIGLMALALVAFVWSFLYEQKRAAYMAWFDSFAPCLPQVRRVWRGLPVDFNRER